MQKEPVIPATVMTAVKVWIWEFDQMCLVMNKCSLQVSLPGGTGRLPLIQHPLTSRSSSNRRVDLPFVNLLGQQWFENSALGQREEKQQQDGERQE